MVRLRETTFLGRVKEFGQDALWPIGSFLAILGANHRRDMLRNESPEGKTLKEAYELADTQYQNRLEEAYRLAYPSDTEVTSEDLAKFESIVTGHYWFPDNREVVYIQNSLNHLAGSPDAGLNGLHELSNDLYERWTDIGSGWNDITFALTLFLVASSLRALARQAPSSNY